MSDDRARNETAGSTAPMTTLVLGARDISDLVQKVGHDPLMDLLIERLRERFSTFDPATTEVRVRDGFRYDDPALGLVEWMPTHERGGPVAVKMVGYHPTNPVRRDLPSVIATASLWNTVTGHLEVIGDATLLTAMRTGAASAIATDVLARDDARTLGLVGLGAQAVTQAHAVSRVRGIERIVGFDTDGAVARTFARRVGFLDVEVEIVDAERGVALAAEVDVLCTCTSVDIGAGPVISAVTPAPGLHVNAVGADFPGKTELPAELLTGAIVVPDTIAQCLVEGECQQLERDQIAPDLSTVVQHRDDYVAARQELTIFDSTGWAVEDDVALRLAHELALEFGLGTEVDLEYLPIDPYDPYATPRSDLPGAPDPS